MHPQPQCDQYVVHIWPDDTYAYVYDNARALKLFKSAIRSNVQAAVFHKDKDGDMRRLYASESYPFVTLHV